MKYLSLFLTIPLAAAVTIVVSDAQPGWDGPNAIDNNPATFWHSVYSPSNYPLPHTATVDLGNIQLLNGFNYLPRQDGNANGRIGQYTLEASTDNVSWTQVASGTWVDDPSRKFVGFPNRNVRYLRIQAITEAGNRGPWTSAAEFGVNVAPTGTAVSLLPEFNLSSDVA
jgi:galactose oxidase